MALNQHPEAGHHSLEHYPAPDGDEDSDHLSEIVSDVDQHPEISRDSPEPNSLYARLAAHVQVGNGEKTHSHSPFLSPLLSSRTRSQPSPIRLSITTSLSHSYS